jgi:transposase
MKDSSCPGCVERDRRIAALEAENRRLTERVATLETAVEEVRRAGKRQAAPFRKTDEPKPDPKTPGRKPGEEYGTKAHRQPPPPEEIDEIHEVPLPAGCPDCGGTITETGVSSQYQVELIRKPLVRKFNIHVGECRCCQRRIQSRHPLQTSDALGAAAAQLGPDAQAMVTLLNKELGLSYGKLIRCLEQFSGIKLSRGGAAQTVLRAGKRCKPAYAEIRQAARDSPIVTLDETGWRVAGRNAWLHAFVTRVVTYYVVAATRGGQVSEDLLGIDYAGAMIHDGWSPYDQFRKARHQQCLAHLIRRSRELEASATGAAVRFPRQVRELLQRGLELRDRFADEVISAHGLAVARGKLQIQMEAAVTPIKRHAGNERLAKFLERHLDDLFTFLHEPGLDATNHQAEQAIRPAVVNRKVWGGNRTWWGARVQSILMSVLRTCWQRGRDALDFLSQTLRATTPPPLLAG